MLEYEGRNTLFAVAHGAPLSQEEAEGLIPPNCRWGKEQDPAFVQSWTKGRGYPSQKNIVGSRREP